MTFLITLALALLTVVIAVMLRRRAHREYDNATRFQAGRWVPMLLAALLILPCATACQTRTAQSAATTQPALSDPTVRLTLVLNAYSTAEESLTALNAQGLIPAKDKPAIAAAVHAARAAIDSAYAHKDDSQTVLQAAIDQATSAMVPVYQFLASHQKPSKGGS